MKKRGKIPQKQGLMDFSKNWNSILRPAINEWRPKKWNTSFQIMYTTYVLTFLGSITKYNCYSTYEHLIMLDVFYKIKTMAIGGNDLVIDNTFSRWIYKSAIFLHLICALLYASQNIIASPVTCYFHNSKMKQEFFDRGIYKPCRQFFGVFWPPPPSWTVSLNRLY